MAEREITVTYDPDDSSKGIRNVREKSTFKIALDDAAALREAANTIEHFAYSDKARREEEDDSTTT